MRRSWILAHPATSLSVARHLHARHERPDPECYPEIEGDLPVILDIPDCEVRPFSGFQRADLGHAIQAVGGVNRGRAEGFGGLRFVPRLARLHSCLRTLPRPARA